MGRDRGSPIPGPQAVLVAVLAVVAVLETVVAVLAVVAVVTVLAVLVAVLVVLAELVAVLVVLAVVVPVLLRDLAQARRHQVPCAAGEDRRGELLDAQRDELVLGVGVPDRGRPGTTEAALGVAAEVVERLVALALFVGEQRDGQRLARDGADEERGLGGVSGAGLGDDLLAVAQPGGRRRPVGCGVLGHRPLHLRG